MIWVQFFYIHKEKIMTKAENFPEKDSDKPTINLFETTMYTKVFSEYH